MRAVTVGCWVLLAAVGVVLAAPETTTVNGTVYVPGGSVATGGTVRAQLSQAGTAADGSAISTGAVTATISGAGAVSIVLVPNDSIQPSNTYYEVRVTTTGPSVASWIERWSVTTQPDPVQLGAVQRLDVLPGRAQNIIHVRHVAAEPSGACTPNETPLVTTTPEPDKFCECVNGNWDCDVMAGSVGGDPVFTDILAGTNTQAAMVVGSGASLAATGTGSIHATDVTCTGCVALGTEVSGLLPLANMTDTAPAGSFMMSGGPGGDPAWSGTQLVAVPWWTKAADATLTNETVVSNLAQLNTALGSSIADGAHTTVPPLFQNVAVSGQSTVAADSTSDTLTLVGAGTVTITTDASTDTVTVTGAGGAGQNVWTTLDAPAGTDPVPDSTTDTLTLAAGGIVTVTGDASTDTVTIAATEAQQLFGTVNAPAGTDPVADTTSDTLNLAAGGIVTVTGDSSTDTVTISATEAQQLFGTLAVSGQTDVAADSTSDTLTLVGAGTVSITTNATSDTITVTGAAGAGQNIFETMNAPAGTDPVPDSTTDTLNWVASGIVSITGDSGTDTLTIGAVEAQQLFSTINAPAGTDPAADGITDTLNLAAGGIVTVTGDSSTDTVTIAATEAQQLFQTLAVSGQTNVVADTTTDTLTLVGAGTVTITTDAGTDTVTVTGAAGAGQNIFQTVDAPAGTDPVADTTADTLVLAAGGIVTITGDSSTDTITISATEGDGSTTNELQNLFSTVAVSGQSDVVADSTTDTLTLAAGSGVTLTTTAGSDTVTIAASGGTAGVDDKVQFGQNLPLGWSVPAWTSGTVTNPASGPIHEVTSLSNASASVWHPRARVWIVVRNDRYFNVYDENGKALANGTLAGTTCTDTEGATIADPMSDYIYVSTENNNSGNSPLCWYSLTSMLAATGGSVAELGYWNIDSDSLQGADATCTLSNSMWEGLTFIPVAGVSDGAGLGGYFLASCQENGSSEASHVHAWTAPSGTTGQLMTEIAASPLIPTSAGLYDQVGMDYDREHDLLYVVQGSANGSNNGVLRVWKYPSMTQVAALAAVSGYADPEGVSVGPGRLMLNDDTAAKTGWWAWGSGGGSGAANTRWADGKFIVADDCSGIIMDGTLCWDRDANTLTAGGGTGAVSPEVDGSTTNELQNLFSTVAVSGQSDVVVDSNTDTLTLVAGTGITLTTNATSDSVTITSSGGGGTAYQTKSWVITSPTSSENLTGFYTARALTVDDIACVVRGSSTPSVTLTVYAGSSRETEPTCAGNGCIESGLVCDTTGAGEHIATASVDDSTIDANTWVWIKTTATSGTVTELAVTMEYHP